MGSKSGLSVAPQSELQLHADTISILEANQPFDRRDAFNLQNTIQEQRRCRAFEVTYLRVE